MAYCCPYPKFLSRGFRSVDSEWMVDLTLLGKALDALNFKPQIDVFASRLNRQFPIYCSFKLDPDASYIDAFTLSWSDKHFYCFPLFSCVLELLKKSSRTKQQG